MDEKKEEIELDNFEKTVSEENQTTSHDDMSSEYQDLLRVDAGGIRGLLERVPLTIKLIVMCVVTLLGMMAIGAFMLVIQARSFKSVRQAYRFQTIAQEVGQYVSAMQTEREASLGFLATPTTRADQTLKKVYTDAVDASIEAYGLLYRNAINGNGLDKDTDNFGEILAKMKTYEDGLSERRDSIIATTISSADAMRYYNEYLAYVVDFLTRFAYVGGAQKQVMSYATMVRLVEVHELLRSLGRIIYSTATLSDVRYRGFYTYVTQRKYVHTQWQNTGSIKARDYYDEVVDAQVSQNVQTLEDRILDQLPTCVNCQLVNYTSVLTSYWSGNMTSKLTSLRLVQRSLSDDMISSANSTRRSSIGTLVALIVLIILFFIISTVTSYILAATIIGPWVRLNKIQEQAISKFVPRGFLRLLHCKRITDLSLGKVVERPLTIMKLDIRNFNQVAKNLKNEQIFEFLSNYLEHVGPIIRRHKGFIDKHQGDGFTALFDSASQGLKASIEIQSASKVFSSQVDTEHNSVEVGLGVHTGDMLVGTVGENERWFHSVLSDQAAVAGSLERISGRLGTGLLTTSAVIENCSKNISKHVEFRFIGRISTENGQPVEVYEILKRDDDADKIEIKESFNEAVSAFYDHKYEECVKLFDTILAKLPKDHVASAYKKRALLLYNQQKATASQLTLADALSNQELFQGMKEFCKQEYSSENILLWETIEKYKLIADSVKRRELAEEICRDFLSLDGHSAVNINQQLKDNIQQEMSANPDASVNLFYSLQKELEHVMGDTLKRFKGTSYVSSAVARTIAAPTLDEL